MMIDSNWRHAVAHLLGAVFLGLALHGTAALAAGWEPGSTAWAKGPVTLRNGPSDRSSAIAYAGTTAPMKLLRVGSGSTSTRWWLVELDGKQGWLRRKQLSLQQVAEPMAEVAMLNLTFEPRVDATQAEDRSAELTRFWQAIQSGTVEERSTACQMLPYSGHVDERFFNALEAWLKARYQEAANLEEAVEADVTRCVQGLATSGNAKYMPTLDLWEQSPQMGRAGRNFIRRRHKALLSDSFVWNPIINRAENHTDGRSWAATRTLNMLQSDMPLLQREGMRRINRKRKEFAELFGAVEKQLLASYKAPTDPIREDIAAWLCKTLAVSHDMKFAPTLTKVAQETSSKKVKRAAENGLDTLQDPPDEEDEAEEPSAEAAE